MIIKRKKAKVLDNNEVTKIEKDSMHDSGPGYNKTATMTVVKKTITE